MNREVENQPDKTSQAPDTNQIGERFTKEDESFFEHLPQKYKNKDGSISDTGRESKTDFSTEIKGRIWYKRFLIDFSSVLGRGGEQ